MVTTIFIKLELPEGSWDDSVSNTLDNLFSANMSGYIFPWGGQMLLVSSDRDCLKSVSSYLAAVTL